MKVSKRQQRLFQKWWHENIEPDMVEKEMQHPFGFWQLSLILLVIIIFSVDSWLFYNENRTFALLGLVVLALVVPITVISIEMRFRFLRDVAAYREWYHVQWQINQLVK